MARPIEATPILTGRDAAELSASLRKTAPEREIERRKRAAREFLQTVRHGKTERERPGAERR